MYSDGKERRKYKRYENLPTEDPIMAGFQIRYEEVQEIESDDWYIVTLTNISVGGTFFYAKQDIYVPSDEMQAMLDALGTKEKALIALDARHVRNHIWHSKLYHIMSELFYALPFEEFEAIANDIDAIRSYYADKISNY